MTRRRAQAQTFLHPWRENPSRGTKEANCPILERAVAVLRADPENRHLLPCHLKVLAENYAMRALDRYFEDIPDRGARQSELAAWRRLRVTQTHCSLAERVKKKTLVQIELAGLGDPKRERERGRDQERRTELRDLRKRKATLERQIAKLERKKRA